MIHNFGYGHMEKEYITRSLTKTNSENYQYLVVMSNGQTNVDQSSDRTYYYMISVTLYIIQKTGLYVCTCSIDHVFHKVLFKYEMARPFSERTDF